MPSTLLRGEAAYHSRRMEREPAIRFARLLAGNSRFQNPMVERAPRSREPRCWWVTYAPTNPAAHDRLIARHQGERQERGRAQWDDYIVYRTPRPNCYDVLNLVNGKGYEVHLESAVEDSCTCEDFTIRCLGALPPLYCKHRTIVQLHVEMELVQEPVVYGRRVETERELVAA